MLQSLVLFISSLLFASLADATALTVLVDPQDKLCYYVLTLKPDSSIGFYFAVQSGGSFDIDFTITSPTGDTMIKGEKERQGDWVFKAAEVGEYEFCFLNKMSTFAEKVVDFEVQLEDDFRAELPKTAGVALGEPVDGMVYSVSNIDTKLNNMLRTLQYYKTRNNRNEFTVKSTESRIFWFSLFEMVVMCLLAGFQVAVVHFFFKGSRAGMV